MKTIFYVLCTAILVTACSSKAVQLTVENPSDFDRLTDLVEIPVASIQSKVSLNVGQVYEVRNNQHELIPSQVTSDGKLLFQAGLKAKATATFTIAVGSQQAFEPKTTGWLVKERFDDFAWENDRVAYHNDKGKGLDNFDVKRTLGAGAMAPFLGDSLWLNENFVSAKVLDNGPLRTTFNLIYKDIVVAGNSYTENRTFSIDAGSQLTKVIQEYGFTEPTTVAVGIVMRRADDILITNKYYIEKIEPKNDKVDGIYIGVVFPQGIEKTLTAQGHALATTTYQSGQPVVYYTGYGWNQYGFADAVAFQTYFAKSVHEPFVITL